MSSYGERHLNMYIKYEQNTTSTLISHAVKIKMYIKSDCLSCESNNWFCTTTDEANTAT